MKKSLSYIAFFIALILLVSAYSQRVVKAEQGYTAPEIEMLANDSVNVSLRDFRGKYVLVNFWDSSNAVSRIAAGEYDRFLHTNHNSPFSLLSVNMDESPELFKEIVKKDKLDEATQFHISDAKGGKVSASYRLDKGFSSYLIDPQGKIVAVNPSVSTLEKYLSKR
ncbi:MAG: TlpA family protein disulfide reductase [Staphylococcus sp.]|nr:TlpA family protein disulfide reductase [Staphylococcus sp.]